MDDKKLIQMAKQARESAYAPYSKFQVGAALVTEDGSVFTGCNIENISYPAGICAERVAFAKAISEGHTRFREIAVVGSTDDYAYPCGMCRQFMAEFAEDEFMVLCANEGSEYERLKFSELLPRSFKAEF